MRSTPRNAGVRLAAAAFAAFVLAPPGFAADVRRAEIEQEVLAQVQKEGVVTCWVVLEEQANLGSSAAMDWDRRGRWVVEQLRATAERSQAPLRGLLRAFGADFTPYWVANVIRVRSDKNVLNALAARPEVRRIEADRVYRIPEPEPGKLEAAIAAVEWNIANIRADLAWSTFGTRGEGIVVANIDTGVQYNHPALVAAYRGNTGGSFDHNYNWFDPALVCGSPSLAPCDNNNHGTHTMGTIAGDGGAGNQIGVAPGARWIAAKGCESSSCTTTSLVAAGQWMLAPTDLTGQNPRPDLRPHVVSNSWGGASGDTFYRQVVQSWVSAGIFPVFANGNSGPSCGTVGSPGDYPESYGVGAYDAANLIASFSSRGPSSFGVTKPDISAPGVNVRSSITGSSYAAFSGTSMATPHVTGVVALMWSAAPSLQGNVADTRLLLDQSAIDTADNTCTGPAADNNVYGEGRLDAYAAVDLSPRGPTGTLRGTVTDADTHDAIAGATVRASGPSNRSTSTDAAGAYAFTLPIGTYSVTAAAFGYTSGSAPSVVVADAVVTVQDFALSAAPSHALSGVVRDTEGSPVPNATVTILGTPIAPARSDASGQYSFASVPDGTYDVRAAAGLCNDPETKQAVVLPVAALDFRLPARTDVFGYGCAIVASSWVDASTTLALAGDDAVVPVTLPFPFELYGVRYTSANVSTNGFLVFGPASAAFSNTAIPSPPDPNAAIYAFWDDLYVDASASVRTGTAPDGTFVVEWRNVTFYGNTTPRVDVEILLSPNGEIVVQYRNIDAVSVEQGGSATLGLENATGTDGFLYSFNETAVADGLAIRYKLTPFTGVEGRVTDANDGLALAGATVRIAGGTQSKTTDASGYYRFYLDPGTYTLEASAARYEARQATVSPAAGQHATQDFALRTGRADVSPASFAFAQSVGQRRTQNLTITNSGGLPVAWTIAETVDVPWLEETPQGGTLAPGASTQVAVAADATGLARGTYSATLVVGSDSGRRPSISVPVSLTVTQYDQAVDSGSNAYYYDPYGAFYWYPDVPCDAAAASCASGYGYSNTASTILTTKHAITGATDATVYKTQRVNPVEYRFESLPDGVYRIQLLFAEIKQVKKSARVFDVTAESGAGTTTLLTAHDVVNHVGGTYRADEHVFTPVVVSGGVLRIRFAQNGGSQPPAVNAIRISQVQ